MQPADCWRHGLVEPQGRHRPMLRMDDGMQTKTDHHACRGY
jgi:hypothetical protein